MTSFCVSIRRMLAGLALIATLGVAVLPEGQLPRVAGPCGRALCNCPVEIAPQSSRTKCGSCHVSFKTKSVLTLGASLNSGADEPGVSFQIAFDAAVVTPHTVPLVVDSNTAGLLAIAKVFVLKLATHEIATPPPRA